MGKTQSADKKRDVKRIKRIAMIVVIGLVLLALVSAALSLLGSHLNKPDVSELPDNGSILFATPDYNEDIATDELYARYNKRIRYLEFGSGEELLAANEADFSPSARFFFNYFNVVMGGDAAGYAALFVPSEREKNNLPERFTKQKIYDITVNLTSRDLVSEGEQGTVREVFEVSYKIKNNNGTFRRDVGSDTARPLMFELHRTGDTALLYSISYSSVSYE